MKRQVPRTANEFERCWRQSPEYQALQREMESHEQEFLVERQQENVAQFREQKVFRQAKHVRPGSPYLISIWMQIRLNTWRAYRRIWNDILSTMTQTLSGHRGPRHRIHLRHPGRHGWLLLQGLGPLHGRPHECPDGHLGDQRPLTSGPLSKSTTRTPFTTRRPRPWRASSPTYPSSL